MKDVFVNPGEVAFSEDPAIMTTVVGSCVAVCIWDRHRSIGGMCHYYLPESPPDSEKPNNYGDRAIRNLLRYFKAAGSRPQDLVSKTLGGAKVISFQPNADQEGIGESNAQVAQKVLSHFQIKISGRALGGSVGRKIRFNSRTGQVQFQPVDAPPPADRPKKILIVDDSTSIRKMLRRIIESSDGLEVCGEAADPIEADERIKDDRPDAITLDINMPRMDGVTYLEKMMRSDPIPTVMVSSLNPKESSETLRALELGAFHYFEKPSFANMESLREDLHRVLLAAVQKGAPQAAARRPAVTTVRTIPEPAIERSLIAIGASTGGTEALRQVFQSMPTRIPPTVVAIHMPPGYSKLYAERLNDQFPFRVVEVEDGMPIEPNTVYLAPGGNHFVVSEELRLIARLHREAPVNGFRPSVDVLFDSLANLRAKNVVGVLLTGMGDDGARGMLNLKRRSFHTMAQDEHSCAVYGMPKVAKEMDAVAEVVRLDRMAAAIVRAVC